MTRPLDYPAPFSPAEAIAPPTDPRDERIEVGILIVGGGPAGLACAIRLGQLLEDAPETAERLGDVPVALIEKGKAPGSHLLSGAVVNPRALRRLFRDRLSMSDMPTYGEIHREAVFLLTRGMYVRIPPPPTMRNHGNYSVSVSELGRFLAEQAEAGGTYLLPETAATKLLVDHGRVHGVRTGDKGRGRAGEELGNFEPGSDIVARVTVLAEGTQGHLTGAAIQHFGLEGRSPQIWALGVKEVWKRREAARPDHPHDGLAAARSAAKYGEFGGSFIYPMGDGHGLDRLRRGARVPRRRVLRPRRPAGVQDAHARAADPRRRRARSPGARRRSREGGYHALPSQFHAPGLLLAGEGAGLVNVPTLKGIHYAIESGKLAAEAAFAALQPRRAPRPARRARVLRRGAALELRRR